MRYRQLMAHNKWIAAIPSVLMLSTLASCESGSEPAAWWEQEIGAPGSVIGTYAPPDGPDLSLEVVGLGQGFMLCLENEQPSSDLGSLQGSACTETFYGAGDLLPRPGGILTFMAAHKVSEDTSLLIAVVADNADVAADCGSSHLSTVDLRGASEVAFGVVDHTSCGNRIDVTFSLEDESERASTTPSS